MSGSSDGTGRRLVLALAALGALAAASVWLQMARDRWFGTDRAPAAQILYVRSPELIKRLVLSYDALASDVYWIRAVQHFGGARRASLPAEQRYELLYPLLDLATELDPYFNIAYRFGAIFLSETPPGGPGRPDLALTLLEKGIRANPQKWQYYLDAGFVHYLGRRDYTKAAEWFRRGSEVPGAPVWMKPLAAQTLAAGGDRNASRQLYATLAESADNAFMRNDAVRRLHQLDALDAVDRLSAIVQHYRQRGGTAPFTWQAIVAAGLLRGTPVDAEGIPYELGPWSGEVRLGAASSLHPLPSEFPTQLPTLAPAK